MRLLLAVAAAVSSIAPTDAFAQLSPRNDSLPGRELAFRQDPGNTAGARMPWFGLKLGGLIAANSVRGNEPTAAGAGFYALFDARDFLGEVSLDLYFGKETRFVAGGIGAYYPFYEGNMTPYLGGGVKFGSTKFGGDGAFGLIPFLGGGMLFGREGYVQFRVDLAWFLALSREEWTERPNDPGTRAHGPILTLGLGF